MQKPTNESHSAKIRITWNIPSIFRQHTGGNSDVELEIADASFRTALKDLLTIHPGLAAYFDPSSSKPQSYITIFHNDQQMSESYDVQALRDGDELIIVPALAGG